MEVERQLDMSLDDIIAKQKKARPLGGKKQTVITLTTLSLAIGEDHMVHQRQHTHLTCSLSDCGLSFCSLCAWPPWLLLNGPTVIMS